MAVRYSVFDPTGNITALVEEPVEIARQPELAARIMRRSPEVEQVGFLSPAGHDALPALRMAGGEFCGNASMCAAALLMLRAEQKDGTLLLRVSGADAPVSLTLRRGGADGFQAELLTPPALSVSDEALVFEGMSGTLPLVRMPGISHLPVESASPFFSLLRDRAAAERAVRAFCVRLAAPCLGLLFLEPGDAERRMTPLVYVPGSGTVFWENSCASGSAAVGMALAARSGEPVRLSLAQPGGVLRVSSDPKSGRTLLSGSVRFVGEYALT